MYLVFDTETTGQAIDFQAAVTDSQNWPRLVELAWAMYDAKGQLLQEHQYLIRPDDFVIPADATAIHHISTARAAAEGIGLAEAVGLFAQAVSQCQFLVVHNAEFDGKVLRAELHRLGQTDFTAHVPALCTMGMSVNGGKRKWPKLQELHRQLFGFDFGSQHRAGADVAACAKCFFELLRQGQPLLGYLPAGTGDAYALTSFERPPFALPDEAAAPKKAANADKGPVRIALVHLMATGPYQSEQRHGLVHLGILPLGAGETVQEWIINPERTFLKKFGDDVLGFLNPVARAAPTWEQQKAEIQAQLAQYGVLLVMDCAGRPSPERVWLENVVLAGMPKKPVCAALDALLSFFLPNLLLDDADDLKEAVLAADKALQAECGYAPNKPQLPFVLHAMRRALRRVMGVVLRPEVGAVLGNEEIEWQPVHEWLQVCLAQPGERTKLLPFRALGHLVQQPTCCDPVYSNALAEKLPVLSVPMRQVADGSMVSFPAGQLIEKWLKSWAEPGATTAPAGLNERPPEGRLSPAAVATGFAHLAASEQNAKHSWQQRPAQKKYAEFVTNAINTNGVYALEAGTGTGKTFGYLVPALEYLRCHPDGLVVVATSTKNLQQQMLEGEIPALLRPKGKRNERYKGVRVAMLKGKNSYLCADALAEAYAECLAPVAPWQQGLTWLYLALRLRDTMGETENAGQAVEAVLTPLNSRRSLLAVWRYRLAADTACRHGDNGPHHPFALCVYEAHRLRAEQAHLLIVNHHKLAVLPRRLLERQGRICIIDEADRFPDNYRSAIATELNAQELATEALGKLLGAEATGRRKQPPASGEEVGEYLANESVFSRLQQRLRAAHLAQWVAAGFDRLGSADDPAAVEELERWDEARLDKLLGNYDLHQQVANLMVDTTLAADTQATATAALAAYEAAQAAQTLRRAIYHARLALRTMRRPARTCLELLSEIGWSFIPSQPHWPALLPFPVGREAHWLDRVRIDQPTGPPHYRNLYWPLRQALAPLAPPLLVLAKAAGVVRNTLPVALQLQTTSEASTAENEAQKKDLRLTRQFARIAEQVGEAADTLVGLLADDQKVRYVPVIERVEGEENNPLGWRLGRAPYQLQPYLEGPLPAQTVGREAKPFFDQFSVTLFTSATIYVENSTSYFRHQLNFTGAFKDSLQIAPAFNHFKEGEEYVAGLLPHYLPKFILITTLLWRKVVIFRIKKRFYQFD